MAQIALRRDTLTGSEGCRMEIPDSAKKLRLPSRKPQIEEILDPRWYMTQERLAVRRTDLSPVCPSSEFDKFQKVGFAESRLRFLAVRVEELRRVSAHRFHFCFPRIRHINNKRRSKFVPLHKFEPDIRPMGLLFRPFMFCVDLGQARIKPRFAAEAMGVCVIGVSVEGVGNDHHGWSEFAYERYDLVEIRLADFDAAVGNLEIPAGLNTQDPCRLFGLARPNFLGPSCSQFPLCQVGEGNGVTELNHSGNGRSARKLNVIGVRADREDVDVHVVPFKDEDEYTQEVRERQLLWCTQNCRMWRGIR